MTTPKSLIREAESDSRNRGPIAVSDFWTKPVGGTIKTNQVYAHFCETLTVVPQIVFYETMSGARMGDNPFAIFDYLQTHRKYQNLLHVWSVNDRENVPEEYRNSPNVVFAHRHSRAYAYFLARAGYVIGNANLPEYFVRRSEQRYLNTWHGIPYKALGRDSPKARFGSWQGTASFLKATHVVTPCRFMTDAVLSAYSMAGTSQALIAETGYPRVDMTVNPSNDRVSAICDILGITGSSVSAAPHKPVVLYAPTWRSDGKQDTVDSEQLLDDLSALAQLDINLLYRGHHRMDKMVGDRMVGDELANITIPPHDISSNELLSVVDILITDYSSIFFDFLPTGRPIIHYVYDLDEYAPTRGLNLTTDELPGTVAKSREDLVRGVNEAAKALAQAPSDADLAANPLQGARYAAAQRRFCPYEDGQATERVVKFFFQDDAGSSPVTYPRDERPTVVYWAGSPGKTAVATEFLAEVIRSGELATEQTTGVFERSASMKADFLKSIKSLKHDLSTVAYVRDTPMLLSSEQQTYSKFEELESPSITEVEKLLDDDPALRKIFSREYRRRLDWAYP